MKLKLSIIVAQACLCTAVAQDVKIQEIDISENKLINENRLSQDKKTITFQEEAVKPLSMNDALKKEFYVDFKKSSEYESEPYIRGRGNKGVPVFIEGMRLNAGHDDSTNLFGLTDIADIEVYRGANGAKLGMGAMSGAVVVKFKEPTFSDKEELELSGFLNGKQSFLSKDGYTTTMGASLYNDTFNFSVSGGINDYDNYEDGNGDEVLHSLYDTNNFNASMSVKTSEDSYVYARYMRDKADSQDPYTRAYNAASDLWTYTSRPNDEGKSYFLGFKKEQFAGLSNIDIQYFKNQLHYDYFIEREDAIKNQQQLFRDSDTHGVKLSAEKALGNHLLGFSASYSDMYISNGVRRFQAGSWTPWQSAFGITEGEIKSQILSLSDDMHFEKLFVNVAAGYERVKREVTSNINSSKYIADGRVPAALLGEIVREDTNEKDDLLSLSATIGYEVSPAFVPYFKVSNATRTPYFNEQYGNNPNMGTQIPNQDLDNEEVYSADIGADGQIGKFYYTSAAYYQKYKDYIELANTGYMTNGTNLPIKQFINLDEAVIYGAELMMGYEVFENIFAEAAYTYTRGKNKEHNEPLAYITPQKLTLSLAQRQKMGLSWEIEQELVDNQDKVSSVNGEVETSGYGLTNLSLSYAFGKVGLFKEASLAFELNNIFDKRYREHLSRVSSTSYYLPNEAGINGAIALHLSF